MCACCQKAACGAQPPSRTRARASAWPDPIRITGFKNGRRYDIVRPKYSEMSTHAGRKTFICFMLSIGVAPQVVMKFTGHADYKSMKPYIDIATKTKSDAMKKITASWEKK